MDKSWGWGILFAAAIAVPGLIGLSGEVRWWWVIVSPLPLVAWTIAWLTMADATRSWRIAISVAVGTVSVVIISVGINGLIQKGNAQPVQGGINAPDNKGTIAPYNSGIFAPNNQGNIIQNQGEPRSPTGLYQSGALVGTVKGTKLNEAHTQVLLLGAYLFGGVDLHKNMEIQMLKIDCPDFLKEMPTASAVQFALFPGIIGCDILGQR